MHVGELRPNANDTLALTVELRITVLSCRRCGSQDYLTRDCKKETSKKCFRCGGDGHFAKDCKSEEYFCTACDEKGISVSVSGRPFSL